MTKATMPDHDVQKHPTKWATQPQGQDAQGLTDWPPYVTK